MKSLLFIVLQYLLPHHGLSRLVGWFAQSEIRWIKNAFIGRFASRYAVNMSEAEEENPLAYPSFNAFFTRALKAGARPLAPGDHTLLCPADGAISQAGAITGETVFQAKGKSFTVEALLGGDVEIARRFSNGSFCTVYLSPKDYHRVHMPLGGQLVSMSHVPGRLFSVNPTTVDHVNGLFARNERVVSVFDTPAGPMAMVLVGAMIVASTETVWAGEVAPRGDKVTTFHYGDQQTLELGKGDEMGRFKLGSTVILLFAENAVNWHENATAGNPVRMGEALGEWREL